MKKKSYFCAIFGQSPDGQWMMDNGRWIRIGEAVLTVCAYGYLLYRLVCFEGYAAWGEQLASAGVWQYVCLAVCVALFPLNILLEACKWRYLLRRIEPMTIGEAQRQVYYGTVGGFVTPYRAGDYPARVLQMRDKSHWASAIGMGIVGSVALTMVIVIAGLPSVLLFFADDRWGSVWQVLVSGGVCVSLLAVLPWLLKRLAGHSWKRAKVQQTMQEIGRLGYGEWLCVIGLSALRYLCFGTQMYLALRFCGAELSYGEAFVAIPLYYLLVTISPNIPIADLGIRGSWAVWVLGHWGVSAPMCAVCVGVMWVCNTVLPMVVGTVCGKENINYHVIKH